MKVTFSKKDLQVMSKIENGIKNKEIMEFNVTNTQLISAVAGNIYRMHPYHNPEGIGEIISRLNKWIDETEDCSGCKDDTFKVFSWKNEDKFHEWLKNFLMDIHEFRELNVSKKNKDAGLNYETQESGFKFSDRYTKETQDERYDDFIDLDACIRNIEMAIRLDKDSEDDCFLCKFAKEYGSMEPSNCEKCKTCTKNPHFQNFRIPHPMAIKPLKDWTEEEKKKYSL